ncbi:hypothetical protein ISCGN_007703 [Ixodes scapularis]
MFLIDRVLKLLGYKVDRKLGDIKARFGEDRHPAATDANPWSSTTEARLDRVYVSGEWSGSVVSYDAKIVPFSDHGFVAAEILAGGPGGVRARRDTPWKMNSSILESEDIIEETRRVLQNLEEGGADAVSWEEFKIKLRDAACALGRRRGAEERQARIHLTNTLKALLEEKESSPGSFSDDIKLCQEYLLAMLEERYKGSQILARRLDTGLKSIIGPHQTYGLRGRKISRNLHNMRAIGEATAEGQQPLAVLQLDLWQAFDRVSHRFLLAALDRFGVGEELREWIALCYRDISTRLLINGQRGGPISIGRSVRQGCPLSPILFALQLEPLCRAVNANPSISSLRLGDEDVRVLAFADDASFICLSKGP